MGTITLYVNAAGNTNPTATDDVTSTDEDTAVVVDVLSNDSDPDSHPLTITGISSPPTNGGTVTVDPVAGTIEYT